MKMEDRINKYLVEKGDLSPYQKFFKSMLKEYGISSPSELSEEEKKKFFNDVEKRWKKEK